MRALVSLILSYMMVNLSVQARSSSTSSNSSNDQNMEEDHKQEKKQKMEDFYTGKYPKRKFKGYDKYPKGRLPDSTPQEILQTED